MLCVEAFSVVGVDDSMAGDFVGEETRLLNFYGPSLGQNDLGKGAQLFDFQMKSVWRHVSKQENDIEAWSGQPVALHFR